LKFYSGSVFPENYKSLMWKIHESTLGFSFSKGYSLKSTIFSWIAWSTFFCHDQEDSKGEDDYEAEKKFSLQ